MLILYFLQIFVWIHFFFPGSIISDVVFVVVYVMNRRCSYVILYRYLSSHAESFSVWKVGSATDILLNVSFASISGSKMGFY